MFGTLLERILKHLCAGAPALPGGNPSAHAQALAHWCAVADRGEVDAALAGLAAVLDGSIADADVHVEIARLRYARGDAAAAERALRAALALRPDLALCYVNLGHIAVDRLDPAAAVEHYDAALAIAPVPPGVELARAGALLQSGDYRRGFEAYECRWNVVNVVQRRWIFERPRWDGVTDIKGSTLLVHEEQGFGDAIQFVRFLPQLLSRGARVILQCQRELLPLFGSIPGIAQCVAKGDALPDFDRQIPLGSLPLVLGTTLETLPSQTPYLTADRGKTAQWRERLAAMPRPLIGLVWASRSNATDAVKKSIAANALLPLLREGRGHLVSLQTGVAANGDEAALLSEYGVPDLAPLLQDFSDTAALIDALDLVITIDTAVAHLAGALGKPLWVLLQRNPAWCWMLARGDTPWYPRAQLFRQQKKNEWSDVVNAATAALKELTGKPRA